MTLSLERFHCLSLPVLAFSLVACVGANPPAESDDAAADTDHASAGETDDTSVDEDVEETEAEELACEAFESETDVGPTVTMKVRNESSEPVFVPDGTPVSIRASDGETVRQTYRDCDVPCDEALTAQNCVADGWCSDGGVPVFLRLDPGAEIEYRWSGTWLESMTTSAECAPGPGCDNLTCWRRTQAPPDVYALVLEMHRSCTGDCECEGEDEGVCQLFRWPELEDPFTTDAVLDYPTETAVEFVLTD